MRKTGHIETLGKRTDPNLQLDRNQRKALEALWEKLRSGEYGLVETDCVCGRRDDRIVGTHDRYGFPLPLVLCRLCGVLRSNPRLDETSLRSFYDRDYRNLYSGRGEADAAFFAEQVEQGNRIRSLVRRWGPEGEVRRVFDVGCGAGGALVPFAEDGAEVLGCDLGSEYLEYGRSEGLRLEHGEATVLGRFGLADLVILSHVLEHVPDPVSMLEGLHDLLSEGGLLYVELPGALNIHGFYGSLRRSMHIAHLYQFSLGTLAGMASTVGFRLVHGDEYVRALLVRTEDSLRIETPGEARKIERYLPWVRPKAVVRRALIMAGLHREAEDDA